MAITRPTLAGPGIYPIEVINPWAVNYYVEEGDPAVEIKAAPTGAGKALYITHMIIGLATRLTGLNVAVTLQDEDANVLFGPIQLERNGQGLFTKHWNSPMKLVDNKALDVFGNVGQTAFTIYIEGFTGDKPLG